ncbi:MAG: hypothetical protein ABL949_16875 [Fimbriimonadaceae bacterium]
MSRNKIIDESRIHKHKFGYRLMESAEFWHSQTETPCGQLITWLDKPEGSDHFLSHMQSVHIPTSELLHRKFAALPDRPEEILTFANTFGWLHRITVTAPDMRMGEYIADWIRERDRLRVLIDIYEGTLAKQKLDPEAEQEVLARLERVRPGEDPTRVQSTESLIANTRTTWVRAIRPQRYWHLLTVEIEREFALGVDIAIPELRPGATLVLRPKDLLGAIYIHFVNEILGSIRTPIKCAGCGKWFTSKDLRTIYCSNACKVRRYRARKREKKNGN